MAESTRPAEPNRSSRARAVCGPTPGTIVSRIRSRRSVIRSRLGQAQPPCKRRPRVPLRAWPARPARRPRRRRRSARRGRATAGGRSGSGPRGSSCRVPSRRAARPGSRPGAVVGRPRRSSSPSNPPDDVRPDPAQSLGQPGLGHHPDGDGLAVLIGSAVAGDRLDGVADRMPEIQDGAKAGLLALVPRDHRRLELAAPGDDPAGAAGRPAPGSPRPSLQLLEEARVEDHAVLDHLGQPAAELAVGERRGASRCRSRRRPAGGTRR